MKIKGWGVIILKKPKELSKKGADSQVGHHPLHLK